MKWHKVAALMYHDFRTFANTKYRLVETFYFPITTVVIWGLFSLFVESFAVEAGLIVLVINIFWSFAQIAQSNSNMLMNEDTWSGSLKHLFVSGISKMEYVVARLISSAMVAVMIVAILFVMSIYVFKLSLVVTHFPLIAYFTVLTLVASLGLAVVVAGLILVFGRDYSFLAWTFLQIFVLLSAPFYPVSIFPGAVQIIAWGMPFTYVFEGMRALIASGVVADALLVNGAIAAAAYFVLSFPFYVLAFRRSQRSGTLARMSN